MKKILSILLISILLGQNFVCAHTINNNSFVANVEITKEPVQLESYLKKRYSGYIYSITNLGKEPIELEELYNYGSNKDAINYIKWDRRDNRFPNTVFMMIIGTLIFPMYTSKNEKNCGISFGKSLYLLYILPIHSTVLAPYYLIKDPIDDKKAAKELMKFKNDFKNIIINPNETKQFLTLTGKKTNISLKELKTGKKCYLCE